MSLTHKTLSRWTCGFDFGFAITLFGYQVGFSFDLTEWHLMAEHHEGLGYLVCVGPIALDILDATKYTPPVSEEEAEVAFLKVDLDRTKKALEQETVRLAGCGVAAMGYGEDLAPETYGYSASYKEVLTLRTKYNQALNEIDKLRKKLDKLGGKNVKGKSLPANRTSGKS